MIALARKYRPKQFSDLIAQDHVAAALRGAVAQGRVAHGYLFAGPRGVGKTTAARILAMALNCQRRTSAGEGEPCGECDPCRRIWTGAANLDVVELDAASNRGVDDARDLRERAMYAASAEGRHKVYIVDEAHMLTRAAAEDAVRLIAKSADGGMRDGLSILDQVLSFGEGPVTAERVREVLGLIPDDVYGELLRLVAERDAKGVFPLVDRLVDAGADLGEFVLGAGEALRAVLLVDLGGEPEGLTEGMVALVRKYSALLPAPDVVRLLTVLSEMETQLRSSGNARLAVELLLLRWAMMSRTVELQAVLQALGKGTGEGGRGTGDAPVLRDAAPPVPRPSSPVPEKGPLTVDRLRALWPRIVEDARAKSPMLGALLQQTEVVGLDGTTVAIRLLDTNPVHAEGLERQREALGRLVGRYVTEPVRIKLEGAGSGGGGRSAPRPPRLTGAGARGERPRGLRARDPSLNAAVDALDL